MLLLKDKVDFTGFTAIIPAVGVGNVAQLSVDLIIATLELKRIGNGWHSVFMPIFGPPAYSHDRQSKTTAFEAYADPTKKIVLFQIRSPLIKQFTESFHNELANFLAEQKFANVIILSSSHAYEKHSVETSAFQYICSDEFKTNSGEKLHRLTWKEFQGTVLHGGGNAQKLLEACVRQKLPSLVLFKYVSEGDNSSDAFQMVGELNQLHKIFHTPVKLTIPLSWNLLFGNDPPELIF